MVFLFTFNSALLLTITIVFLFTLSTGVAVLVEGLAETGIAVSKRQDPG
jgi:hypothetical protein